MMEGEDQPLLAASSSSSSLVSSPSKSVKSNISSKDIFRIANQSVDQFLNEIELNNHISDITSLPELSESPLTEPLNVEVEKNILGDLDNDIAVSNNLPHEDSVVLSSTGYKLNGPKAVTNSPTRSPKKVTIDDSPSKIHNYETPETDTESDLEDDTPSAEKQEMAGSPLKWTRSQIKPFDQNNMNILSVKFSHIPSKPLPEIIHSKSDYSIHSMPNLSYQNFDTDESDSDLTLAPSPAPASARISPYNKGLKRQNSLDAANQFYYDHDHYVQDLERGTLVESESIKKNISNHDNLRNSLLESESNKNKKQMCDRARDNLLDGFQIESDINRSGSVKSTMSISPQECKLETSLVKEAVDTAVPPKHENLIKLTKEENYEPSFTVEKNSLKKSTSMHHHKRSSSLSDFVGNIIKSFSTRTISQIDPDSCDQNIIPYNPRNVSVQSVATTITESGFLSADDGLNNGPDDNSATVHVAQEEDYTQSEDESDVPDQTVETIKVGPNDEVAIASNQSLADSNGDISLAEGMDKEEHTLDKLDEANKDDMNESDTSIRSSDCVLHVPFEDDIFDHEFDDFNKSIKSRNTSNTSTNSSHRIISIECAERNEVLEIWSKQKRFNLPFRKHKDFDSIEAPIKSYIVNLDHPKAVHVLTNDKPHHERLLSEGNSPPSWIYNKLEVLPSGVNMRVLHNKTNSLATTCTVLNEHYLDKNNIFLDKNHDNEESEFFIDESGDSVIQHVEAGKETGVEPIHSVKPSDENNELTIDLSTVSHGFSEIDNSLLREIQSLNPDYSVPEDTADEKSKNNSSIYTFWNQKNTATHKAHKDSIDILKEVWKNDSISSPVSNLDNDNIIGLTHSDTFHRFNNKNIENYLNKKRITSDEYHLKESIGAKIQLQNDPLLLPEQRASIYQYGNESYSKIVPELGIADGNFENDMDNYTINSDEASILNFEDLKQQDILSYPQEAKSIELPKSPVSPARKKMLDKFEQQVQQRKTQEAHKKLQQKLQQKIHEEAQIIEAFYPQTKDETKSRKVDNADDVKLNDHSKNKIHTPNEDSVDDIYEEFSDSPTKIKMNISVSPSNLFESPFQKEDSANPFESPKIKKIITTEKNVLDRMDNIDFQSINPFAAGNTPVQVGKAPSNSENPIVKNNTLNSVKSTVDVNETTLVNGEQGRLFLRLQDVSGLKLPDLKKRNAKFQLTLDNGIHCLKTEFIDVSNENINSSLIKIDKEFELIVAANLNIIITLKLKYDKPKSKTVEVTEKKEIKSKSMMGKLMGKKEVKTITKTVTQPPEEDKLAPYLASDGSFCKLKINFEDYKKQIFAKASTYSLTCYNEWKSTKTKKGTVKNFQPLPICNLNMKMMFIPRKYEKENLPISIANAMNQLKEARKEYNIKHEGYMSQQGGDLKLWTRRFYKLDNYDLLAYNLSNTHLKAKINLKRVVGVGSQTSTSSGVKAADEASMSNTIFRLKFSNNETIDFQCDSVKERDEWMSLIQQLISLHQFSRQPWLNAMMTTMKDVPIA